MLAEKNTSNEFLPLKRWTVSHKTQSFELGVNPPLPACLLTWWNTNQPESWNYDIVTKIREISILYISISG